MLNESMKFGFACKFSFNTSMNIHPSLLGCYLVIHVYELVLLFQRFKDRYNILHDKHFAKKNSV